MVKKKKIKIKVKVVIGMRFIISVWVGRWGTFLYISVTRFISGFANGRKLILANSF